MLDPTPTIVRLITVLPTAAVLVCACSGLPAAPTSPAPQPSAEAAPAPQPAPSPSADPALERRIGSLELQLLETTAQVEELQERLDEARREVVRSMARQQSVATRAEAASGMAEAELALQSLPDSAPPRATAEIRQLTQQSSVEFEKSNYGGALYLANQAKGAAMSARGQLAEVQEGSLRPYERSLALPLQLETRTGANVRSGPGTGFNVLFTLPAQTPVVAYSSAEQWLRIADDSGRGGWISQGLIRGRP
jgi:Bacterial SH3 domain